MSEHRPIQAQLGRGGRAALDELDAILDAMDAHAHNPGAVRAYVRKARGLIREQVEPRMHRAAPAISDRLGDMDQTIAELMRRIEQLEAGRILTLREKVTS